MSEVKLFQISPPSFLAKTCENYPLAFFKNDENKHNQDSMSFKKKIK